MLKRALGPFKEFGFAAGLLYVIGRGLNRVSSGLGLFFYELMVQPIPPNDLISARMAKGIEIRRIRRGDPEIELMPARPEIKEARFAQDAICLGAFRKGKLIGYIWFCVGTYEEDEVRCTYVLAPGEQAAFDFDLYIFPEYRMSLAFVGIWNGANEYLRGRGIGYTFSRVTRFNNPSRRAHAHLGAIRVGRALFLRTWNLEFMVATLRPFIHLSLGQESRVRLSLRRDSVPASVTAASNL